MVTVSSATSIQPTNDEMTYLALPLQELLRMKRATGIRVATYYNGLVIATTNPDGSLKSIVNVSGPGSQEKPLYGKMDLDQDLGSLIMNMSQGSVVSAFYVDPDGSLHQIELAEPLNDPEYSEYMDLIASIIDAGEVVARMPVRGPVKVRLYNMERINYVAPIELDDAMLVSANGVAYATTSRGAWRLPEDIRGQALIEFDTMLGSGDIVVIPRINAVGMARNVKVGSINARLVDVYHMGEPGRDVPGIIRLVEMDYTMAIIPAMSWVVYDTVEKVGYGVNMNVLARIEADWTGLLGELAENRYVVFDNIPTHPAIIPTPSTDRAYAVVEHTGGDMYIFDSVIVYTNHELEKNFSKLEKRFREESRWLEEAKDGRASRLRDALRASYYNMRGLHDGSILVLTDSRRMGIKTDKVVVFSTS